MLKIYVYHKFQWPQKGLNYESVRYIVVSLPTTPKGLHVKQNEHYIYVYYIYEYCIYEYYIYMNTLHMFHFCTKAVKHLILLLVG